MPQKLGGTGDVAPIARREVGVTTGFGDGGVSDIAKGINSLVQSAGTIALKFKAEKNSEDAVMLKQRAETDYLDSQLALSGKSTDNMLNDTISSMRSSGYSETSLAETSWRYKEGKAIEEFGLNKGEKSNEAEYGYFHALNRLSMSSLVKQAEVDKDKIKLDIGNKIFTSFKVPSADMQKTLNDGTSTGKTYTINEDAVGVLAIRALFARDKEGDTKAIDSLKTLTNSSGERIIDSIEGSALYGQLIDAKEKRAKDKVSYDLQIERVNQDKSMESFMSGVIGKAPTDMADAKVDLDNLMKAKKITFNDYKAGAMFIEAKRPSNSLPKVSDPIALSKYTIKALEGTLTGEDHAIMMTTLDQADFSSLITKGYTNGGLHGVGTVENKALEESIDPLAKSISGLPLEYKLGDALAGGDGALEKYSLAEKELRVNKNTFTAKNKRLPNADEWEGITRTAKDTVEKQYESNKKTRNEDEVATIKPTTTNEEITKIMNRNPTRVEDIRKAMTTEQLNTRREALLAKKNTKGK